MRMAKAVTPPQLPLTLPPLQDPVVVLHKGFTGSRIDVCTLEELTYRELPLWRRALIRLRRRR